MTDEPTVRDRAAAAGISPDRLDQALREGRVWVDGEVVHNLDTPAPKPIRVTFGPG